MPLYNPPVFLGRWLTSVAGGTVSTNQAFGTAGRVYMTQIIIPVACQIDGLAYSVGTTSAGNVIGGLLGPIARTADTPVGAVVVAQSASTAQGSTSVQQILTWTAVTAQPGVYYACIEGDDVTGTFMRHPNIGQAVGIAGQYDRAGGYGALTDPTPASTVTGNNNTPGIRLRLA